MTTDTRERLFDEGLEPIPEAWAKATGRSICPKTGLRLAIRGKRGLRLESLKVSGRRLTSVAACRRFVLSIQETEPTPASRALDDASSENVLRAHGLGRACN